MESETQKFLDFALGALRQQKKEIIDKVSDAAVERIETLSLGQMNPVVTKGEDGFVVSILPGPLDPTGAGLAEVEKKTKAVSETVRTLNKDYVVSLINRAE